MKGYWKPFDASADPPPYPLSFEQSGCSWEFNGTRLRVSIDATYPATPGTDARTALIGGMPYKAKRGVSPVGGGVLKISTIGPLSASEVPSSSSYIKFPYSTTAYLTNANLTNARITGFIDYPTEDVGPTVFAGDSITSAWPLSSYLSGAVNAGFSGDTSWMVLKRFNTDVLAQNPSAVPILEGTNDIQHFWIDVSAVKAKARMARDYGSRPLICTIPPFVPAGVMTHDMAQIIVDQWNDGLRRLADAERLPLVDYHRAMILANGEQNTSLFGSDGVHPNTAGYDVMWSVLRQFV